MCRVLSYKLAEKKSQLFVLYDLREHDLRNLPEKKEIIIRNINHYIQDFLRETGIDVRIISKVYDPQRDEKSIEEIIEENKRDSYVLVIRGGTNNSAEYSAGETGDYSQVFLGGVKKAADLAYASLPEKFKNSGFEEAVKKGLFLYGIKIASYHELHHLITGRLIHFKQGDRDRIMWYSLSESIAAFYSKNKRPSFSRDELKYFN